MIKKNNLLFMICSMLAFACQHERVAPIRLPEVYDKYATPDVPPLAKDVKCQCAISCQIRYDTVKFLYGNVCFNAQNPYQIAYLRNKPATLRQDLYTFDFESGAQKLIATNAAYGLSWSRKGWLAFTGVDRQIYKVKANGDSLTRLTNHNYYCSDPQWNPAGDQLVFSTDVTGYYHIITETGVFVDTIQTAGTIPPENVRWVDANEFFFSAYDGSSINKVNLSTKIVTPLHNAPLFQSNHPFLIGVSLTEKKVFWTYAAGDDHGYMVTNIEQKKGTVLQQYPSNYRSGTGNYSPLSNKIIRIRNVIDFFPQDACLRTHYNYVTIMNTDGTDERKVLLPY
jgi:dipeptidyl aminopeptidase/acylaminoacyl peptidase